MRHRGRKFPAWCCQASWTGLRRRGPHPSGGSLRIRLGLWAKRAGHRSRRGGYADAGLLGDDADECERQRRAAPFRHDHRRCTHGFVCLPGRVRIGIEKGSLRRWRVSGHQHDADRCRLSGQQDHGISAGGRQSRSSLCASRHVQDCRRAHRRQRHAQSALFGDMQRHGAPGTGR